MAKELSEKEFIHEEYKKNPYPLWLWLFVMAILMVLLWGASEWFPSLNKPSEMTKSQVDPVDGDFNQVSNREFSLFLWQNPAYMRVNLKKTGYLPAFQVLDKITVEPDLADRRVVAPPEILFLYHAWSRLLRGDYIPRAIPKNEFIGFIDYCEEWQPGFWSAAPTGYVGLYQHLSELKESDLQVLPEDELPVEVRMAFQGWKNNFMESAQINALKPTYGEMAAFLKAHPNYGRNFWGNILHKEIPNYLKGNFDGEFVAADRVSSQELAPFLKIAFFNYHQAELKR